MERTWDTADLDPADQMSYWADVVCEAFTPLSPSHVRLRPPPGGGPAGLSGWVRSERLADTNSAEIASCTQRLTHGAAEVRRAPSEQVFVNLQLEGTGRGEQDGRSCVVRPGAFALFDTTRPYRLEFEEASDGTPWRVLSFRIPRDQIMALLPQHASSTARAVDATTGAGAVAADMMRSLWTTRNQLSPSTKLALDHAFTEVVATALGAFDTTRDIRDKESVDEALRAAVNRFVLERIPRGQVLAVDAARHVGISVRKLHQLYDGQGQTFGGTVRDLRLQRAARQLEDGACELTVTDIASRWGFCDASHLTRAFRQRYGVSPAQYRAGARA